MCQAAPVFSVPKLPVPERAPVLSGPVRKTPDQSQAHSVFHVIRLGFEPKTHSLEGCCSIQLSYRTEPYYLTLTGLGRFDIVIVPVRLLSKVDAKIGFILLNSK